MSTNLNSLATMAADLIETIEESYDADVELRTIAIAVEVDTPKATHFVMNCSDDRPWVQLAFLNQALDQLEHRYTILEAQDDDD